MDRRQFIWVGGAGVASLVALNGPLQAALAVAENTPALSTAGRTPLLFGTDYYPDQTPERLWQDDAAAMASAGITNVRIAEFAWALMEPKEGSFDFKWLIRAVGILHAHGIAVILGTPSAAPPNWLSQKYPEILEVNAEGVTLAPGTRRFTCPTNATYRKLSLKIATEMAQTFATTEGVIGWQIDNELTLASSGRCYCRYCRDGFQQWLRTKYQSLDVLNQVWGTVFWSNTYTDFAQVPVPLPSGAPPNPGLALDYDRYQSDANVSFLEEQLAMLRKQCPSHFVTTNNVGGLVDNIDMRALYRNLDFVAFDNYPGFSAMFDEGNAPGSMVTSLAMAPTISFGHDYMRSAKDGKPFLIMEEQSGKAGQPIFSPQPEPGQVRLWSYQAVAHGAMGINYFRWDTANSGAEEYWHGMLRHDRSHSPAFNEMVQTMREMKSLGENALHARYDAELALCFDLNADWALQIQPGQPQLKYLSEIVSWYASMSASQAGIDVVDATLDLSRYKVLCAPVMYVVTPQQAERIRSFVAAGGTFIAGCRLGVKDEHSRIVDVPLPGLLHDVMGVEVLDYEPVFSEKGDAQRQNVRFSGVLAGAPADCRLWTDILDAKEADVLATYTSRTAAGKAAITANTFGNGKAIYIGAHLDPADMARVMAALLKSCGVTQKVDAPAGVEVTRRSSGKKSWLYLLNHTAAPQTIGLTGRHGNALDGSTVPSRINIEAYGVRVLVEG